jgi:hypothetical protein
VAAGMTIAVLALAADVLLALVQRSIVSPGISGRYAPSATFRRSLVRTPIHVTARRPSLADVQGGR